MFKECELLDIKKLMEKNQAVHKDHYYMNIILASKGGAHIQLEGKVVLMPFFTFIVIGIKEIKKGIIRKEEIDYTQNVITILEIPYQGMYCKGNSVENLVIWLEVGDRVSGPALLILEELCRMHKDNYKLLRLQDIE